MKKTLVMGVMALALMSAGARADGDATKGQSLARQCQACHSMTDATNKVGPSLLGVYGRQAAAVEGYAYSDAMKAFGATGAKWDDANLDKYLQSPMAFIPGIRMAFAGLKKADQRADVIAYLKTLK